MPEVKKRTTIFIGAVLDSTGSFSHTIDVPHHCHDMVYNSWVCGDTTSGVNNDPFTIALDGYGKIGSFTEQFADTPKHVYSIDRLMSGTYTFNVRNHAGAIIDQTGCQLLVSLEFIEFHE